MEQSSGAGISGFSGVEMRDEANRSHFSLRWGNPEELLCLNREKTCPFFWEVVVLTPFEAFTGILGPEICLFRPLSAAEKEVPQVSVRDMR